VDASTHAWMDQHDAHVAEVVRRRRWYAQYVGGGCARPGCHHDDDLPFAYSVGLFGLGHPELLVFSLPPGTVLELFDGLGARIVAGGAILPGCVLTVDGFPRRIVPEPVPNPGEIVFEANRFYRRPDAFSVPVLQLSYDDVHGWFPWEADYDGDPQPRPGTFRA